MAKVNKPQILHKRFEDYTKEELLAIKREKCLNCNHFAKKGTGNEEDFEKQNNYAYLNVCTCNYLIDMGSPRICRPELCPYSNVGGGIKLNESTHEKFVNFEYYCNICKYKDTPEFDEPCHECLANPVNYESMKPIKWEKKENQS